jgi:hypothetical protein
MENSSTGDLCVISFLFIGGGHGRYCQINRFQGDHRDTEGESPAGVLLCSRLCSRDLPPDVPSVGHLLAILSGAKAVTSGTEV